MTGNFGSTLFLVASPFQCLCMIEAIHHFNIKEYDVLVPFTDIHSLKPLDVLLKKNNIPYEKKKVGHLIFDIFPFLFSSHKFYRNIFIGNLYSEPYKALANIFGGFRANVYYLDDGVQALSFFESFQRTLKYTTPVKTVIKMYQLLGKLKGVRKPVFFTIFDVHSNRFKIIKNTFTFLKPKSAVDCAGVYIIGTNSSVLDFMHHSYSDFISLLSVSVSKRFPGEQVYYCPHRRDVNNRNIQELCEKLGVIFFDTEISVEVDFIGKEINPKYVVGFTSNALYTLRMLYPATIIETVYYDLISENHNLETKIIRAKMAENDIDTVHIY